MRVRKDNNRVDGSFPKYYICHYSCCSIKDLQLENRDKCLQGNVGTDHLEQYIWDQLTFVLTGQHHDPEIELNLKKTANSHFDYLTGENVVDRIVEIENKILRLEEECKKKDRANGRLLDLLETEEVNLDSVRNKLRENEQVRADYIEAIIHTKNDLLEFNSLLKDQESFLDNRDILFDIWSDLQDFDPIDKKQMIESLIPEGITISIEKNPHHGRRHYKRLGPDNVHFDLVWNSEIFQYYKDKGKFTSLGQNGSDHSNTHENLFHNEA